MHQNVVGYVIQSVIVILSSLLFIFLFHLTGIFLGNFALVMTHHLFFYQRILILKEVH